MSGVEKNPTSCAEVTGSTNLCTRANSGHLLHPITHELYQECNFSSGTVPAQVYSPRSAQCTISTASHWLSSYPSLKAPVGWAGPVLASLARYQLHTDFCSQIWLSSGWGDKYTVSNDTAESADQLSDTRSLVFSCGTRDLLPIF